MAATRTPRRAWIDAGLRALAAGGPDAVRIEPLAKALGVTKGGFYWHFADRGALLEEMLDTWQQTSVDEVIARIDAEGGDARTRLGHLFALAGPRRELREIELAVRDWARRDAGVARRLGEVDERRMAFLRAQFAGFVADPDEVEVRSLLVFSLWIAHDLIAAEHPGRTRAEVLALATRGLLA